MKTRDVEIQLSEALGKIGSLQNELKETNQGVVALNLELEQRIEEKERAEAALRESNEELEAFSYSVSHDLKAPLRAITGFIHILANEYSEVLDEEGKRIMAIVQNNAAYMAKLIDDILTFSRLGRKVLMKVPVDMDNLIEGVIRDIRTHSPETRIKFIIAGLPNVSGDRSLLYQVWYNLISNAVKYSSKEDEPIVEIGGDERNGEAVYTVRDNGCGFDMQYADRLFGIFQRLHSSKEYEGTGIGLANVKRIVTRHGGRVWAESAIGRGATFTFTIPMEDGNHDTR